MSVLICPKCGSDRIHRSRRRDVMEKIFAAAGKTRRCHSCDSRFIQFGEALIRITDMRQALRRVTVAAGLVLATALVLAVIMWIDRLQSAPTGQSRLTIPVATPRPPSKVC